MSGGGPGRGWWNGLEWVGVATPSNPHVTGCLCEACLRAASAFWAEHTLPSGEEHKPGNVLRSLTASESEIIDKFRSEKKKPVNAPFVIADHIRLRGSASGGTFASHVGPCPKCVNRERPHEC